MKIMFDAHGYIYVHREMSSIDKLSQLLRKRGAIPAARVSSAQARGNAKNYSYWGAVKYEIRIANNGKPSLIPLERASSDRRSYPLAEMDAKNMAQKINGIYVSNMPPGQLRERQAEMILEMV